MKTYSEFLRESTIVEGASIIRAGSRKKSTYRGPTGDHKRDAAGHIVADFYKKKPAPTGNKGKKIDYKKPKRDLVAMRARKKASREKREARERERAAAATVKDKKKLKEDAPTMSAGNGGFSSNPENPANQGYDPLMKMMSRWKKAKTYPNKMADVVNRGKNGR